MGRGAEGGVWRARESRPLLTSSGMTKEALAPTVALAEALSIAFSGASVVRRARNPISLWSMTSTDSTTAIPECAKFVNSCELRALGTCSRTFVHLCRKHDIIEDSGSVSVMAMLSTLRA